MEKYIYFHNYFSANFYNLVPSINNIINFANIIKKYTHNKLIYHLYSNISYFDQILLANGIREIIAIEPDIDLYDNAVEIRRALKNEQKEMLTLYNHDPLSNDFNYSDGNVIIISFPKDIQKTLEKIEKECKSGTMLIIESHTKIILDLKFIKYFKFNDVNYYIYKLK